MFNLFRKNPKGETVKFEVLGMHCTSCALDIDGTLEEELDGVISSNTSYAKSEILIEFDSNKISKEIIKKTIGNLGYRVTIK